MTISATQREFLETHHAAAMITVGDDGMAKAVRVGVALVDDGLWSSGTRNRIRTERLKRDPRCTLFVFDGRGFAHLTLETRVTVIDGPDAVDASVRLFRVMQGRPDGPLMWYGTELDEEAFRRRMRTEGRLVYEFDVEHAYGIE